MGQLLLNARRARDDASFLGFSTQSVGISATGSPGERPPVSPSKAAVAPMPLPDPDLPSSRMDSASILCVPCPVSVFLSGSSRWCAFALCFVFSGRMLAYQLAQLVHLAHFSARFVKHGYRYAALLFRMRMR